MGKELRGGYTTGACMAAGVKAALLYRAGEYCERLTLTALDGTPLEIPVKEVRETEDGICAEIVKDAGDDPDITNGASVFTTIRELPSGSGIMFRAGEGIGTVTKAGLSVPVGSPAINPGPRKLTENPYVFFWTNCPILTRRESCGRRKEKSWPACFARRRIGAR